MSRRSDQRLADIVAAASAIGEHLERGPLTDRLVFDAVRVRLIEIGEAVKDIEPGLLAREPEVLWSDVAGMRNHLAHRYFDTRAQRRPRNRRARSTAARECGETSAPKCRRRQGGRRLNAGKLPRQATVALSSNGT